MIKLLSGRVVSQKNGATIIQTNDGVGWDVKTGSIVLEVGQQAELYIFTQFREYEISLWGFLSLNDLEMFELLISVNGVGARIAHSMVTELGRDLIIKAISLNDANSLKISGVGLKTAQKIIFALKEKITDQDFAVDESQLNLNQNFKEALDALEGLGYNKVQVSKILKDINEEFSNLSTEDLVKLALKNLK
ncbi:MAG: Holliday junction ATP-dependent DNA helicase RuvA [Candidatus Dojkabacteria bacterium]|nr:MAG: Holliday junction ATP-dependent DNA helicase RuvA [Candidatus Dojkabacteria bacterium]